MINNCNGKNNHINILLVNPWIIDFKAYDLWMKPLGLLNISSILRRNGYNVYLIDCLDRNHESVIKKGRDYGTGKFESEIIEKPALYKKIPRYYKRYGISLEAFLNDLKKIPHPDIILVTSGMTYWYPGVHLAISMLKEKYPSIPVILGGIYATVCSDFAKIHSRAVVFPGSNMSEFLYLLETYTGINHTFYGPFSPDYSHYEKLDYASIVTSKGCPYNCTYCASKKLDPSFVSRNPYEVISEIKFIKKSCNISDFAFYDDALLLNPGIKTILEEVSREYLKFHTPNGVHSGFIDLTMAGLLRKAGFKIINLSLETVDENIRILTGNKVKIYEFESALDNLYREGFSKKDIRIYTMMAIPGQTFHEVDKTIDYIFKLGLKNNLSVFSPVPGSCDFTKIKSDLSDPLTHNTSYQYYVGEWFTFEERKFLMDKVHRLNSRVS
jgi:radical SAM superfamily enzyme YgiQ (UPF0313 family)